MAEPASPASTVTFETLGVRPPVVAALAALGAQLPFPVQQATLPSSLAGRDILGRGRTGSGKTIAFAVPLVMALHGERGTPRRPRGLVLAPTRELARQIDTVVSALAGPLGLTSTSVFGGVSVSSQVKELDRGVDIVVACPGRLEDLIVQGKVHLDRVQVAVLDEADHMADLGFLPAVRRLLDQVPAGGQRMLFSATLDQGVDTLVDRYLDRPARHSVDEHDEAPSAMSHRVVTVGEGAERVDTVHGLVVETSRAVVFTRTKHRAKRMCRQLVAAGVGAVELHGNLSQSKRVANLAAFGDGTATVLVATDIAARGIHVDDVELVVHADPPTEHKAYLHRSGRTARAGGSGEVVTLVSADQRRDVDRLLRSAGVSVDTRPAAHPLLCTPERRSAALSRTTPDDSAAAHGQQPARSGGWTTPMPAR